jgi:hypothetical protein
MFRLAGFTCIVGMGWLWALAGCERSRPATTLPEAQRPVMKSEAQLAEERQERVAAGRVVAEPAAPRLAAEPQAVAPRSRLTEPLQPTDGAIQGEILIVNSRAISIPEVLYPVRERLGELRATESPDKFAETARQIILARTQQAVGALLIHAEAMANLPERQRTIIEDGVEREIQRRISREFGGSQARFEQHLAANDLATTQYRELLTRDLVAREYAREKLLPQITVRRDELLNHYRRNQARYSEEETRELWLIEAPFEAYLPPQTTWARAAETARARARLSATRDIRAAYEALEARPFEEVAREFSRGVHADLGGNWGEIGRPLQPPYDQVSAPIFTFATGQYSEPIQTERGWYIARCGQIKPAVRREFAEVQEEIREQLLEEKFQRLSAEYMMDLAERATISPLDKFVSAAVRRVLAEPSSQRRIE